MSQTYHKNDWWKGEKKKNKEMKIKMKKEKKTIYQRFKLFGGSCREVFLIFQAQNTRFYFRGEKKSGRVCLNDFGFVMDVEASICKGENGKISFSTISFLLR